MILASQITANFDAYINRIFKNHPDIRGLMINHELKNHFVEQLCKEIRLCELRMIHLDSIKIKKLSEDFARMFAQIVLNHKEAQIRQKFTVVKDYEQQHTEP